MPVLERRPVIEKGNEKPITTDASADTNEAWAAATNTMARVVLHHMYALHLKDPSVIFRVEGLDRINTARFHGAGDVALDGTPLEKPLARSRVCIGTSQGLYLIWLIARIRNGHRITACNHAIARLRANKYAPVARIRKSWTYSAAIENHRFGDFVMMSGIESSRR